jgi:hypothetical protein
MPAHLLVGLHARVDNGNLIRTNSGRHDHDHELWSVRGRWGRAQAQGSRAEQKDDSKGVAQTRAAVPALATLNHTTPLPLPEGAKPRGPLKPHGTIARTA